MRKASHGLLSAPAAATPGATEKQRRASVLMRQHLMFFNEADVDGDSALDFEEFVAALPENVRTAYPQRKLRQFFRLADEDGSGSITMSEFVTWSLAMASRHGLDSARSERLVSDAALDQRLEDGRRRQAAIKVQSLVRGRATRKKQRMASQP